MKALVSWLCAWALLAAPAAEAARKRTPAKAARTPPPRPEDNPRLGGDAKAFARARVRFREPSDLAQLAPAEDGVRVSIEVSGYALGPAKDAAPGAPVPHAHLIVDDGATLTFEDASQPLLLSGLRPGPHALRVVLCRPWHEVVKARGAFALARFRIGPRGKGKAAAAAEEAAWPDPKKPLLTYVLPLPLPAAGGPQLVSVPVAAAAVAAGQAPVGADADNPPPQARDPKPAPAAPADGPRKRQRPVLDFYLANARLGHHGARIRLVVDKKEYPTVRAFRPVRLDPLKPGEHHVSIDLLDRRGTKVRNALNRNDRTFVLP